MEILSKDELDGVLLSNVPYRKKMELLNKEKEYIENAIVYYNSAINNFTNGAYLPYITEVRDNLKKDVRSSLIKGTFSGSIGIFGAVYEMKALSALTYDPDFTVQKFIAHALITFAAIILGFTSASELTDFIDDRKELEKYNRCILEYQKKLK